MKPGGGFPLVPSALGSGQRALGSGQRASHAPPEEAGTVSSGLLFLLVHFETLYFVQK